MKRNDLGSKLSGMKGKLVLWAVILSIGCSGWAASAMELKRVRWNCTLNDCPVLDIQHDEISRYPGGQVAAFRGFADPCIRRDPASGTL